MREKAKPDKKHRPENTERERERNTEKTHSKYGCKHDLVEWSDRNHRAEANQAENNNNNNNNNIPAKGFFLAGARARERGTFKLDRNKKFSTC